MEKTEYITIKNASRKVLLYIHQIGIDKAQRLQEVQKRWMVVNIKIRKLSNFINRGKQSLANKSL